MESSYENCIFVWNDDLDHSRLIGISTGATRSLLLPYLPISKCVLLNLSSDHSGAICCSSVRFYTNRTEQILKTLLCKHGAHVGEL